MTISSGPHPAGPTGDDHPGQPPADAAVVGLVVLAGGTSRRWAGQDKTAADLAGRPVVVHVVAGARGALGHAVPAVVVAPAEHVAAAALAADGVTVVREDPPGGGPVAGLAAGLAALPAGTEVVALVAGDVPFGGPALRRAVSALTADPERDAVVGEDPQGRRQPLLGAYRTAPLRAALAAGVEGRSVRSVLADLAVGVVPVDTREALDLDTPDDLAVAAALVDP